MALKDDILALFPDNAAGEITAQDLRDFVTVIFDNKENKIYKLSDPSQLSTVNVNIQMDDLIIFEGGSQPGIYKVLVDQPTVFPNDFQILIKLNLPEIPNCSNSSDDPQNLVCRNGTILWERYGTPYVAGKMNIEDILQLTPTSPGVMYIASNTNLLVDVPGNAGDVYSWTGCKWANIGNIFACNQRYWIEATDNQSDFYCPENIPSNALVFSMGALQNPNSYTIIDNLLRFDSPQPDGATVVIQF